MTDQKTLVLIQGSGEYWRYVRELRRKKRASNRKNSSTLLVEAGIRFTTVNVGEHLIVEGPDCHIDFWPGSGKWAGRNGIKGLGVFSLIAHICAARAQGDQQ